MSNFAAKLVSLSALVTAVLFGTIASGSAQMCSTSDPNFLSGHTCMCPYGTNHFGQKGYHASCGEMCSCTPDSYSPPPASTPAPPSTYSPAPPPVASKPPKLGVEVELTGSTGAVVTSIVPNSPAEFAGIENGDKILTLNGHGIRNGQQLVDELAALPNGSQVTLSFRRRSDFHVIRKTITLSGQKPGAVPSMV